MSDLLATIPAIPLGPNDSFHSIVQLMLQQQARYTLERVVRMVEGFKYRSGAIGPLYVAGWEAVREAIKEELEQALEVT